MTSRFNFFKKKSWRMRIWYASIFLSLLAGKLRPIEQSAGVTQFMEIFSETANIKPAHLQKAQSET